MFSTSGRRRILTDAQVRRILEWQRNRKTLVQVARENGVSPRTIYKVIEEGEQYKRSPLPMRLASRPGPISRLRARM
jgi:hypothetical protein